VQVEQPNGSTKSFAFNVTFEPDATQEDVFENCGVKKLVDMAVEGSVIYAVLAVERCASVCPSHVGIVSKRLNLS